MYFTFSLSYHLLFLFSIYFIVLSPANLLVKIENDRLEVKYAPLPYNQMKPQIQSLKK